MLQPSSIHAQAAKRRKLINQCMCAYAGGPIWGLDWAPGTLLVPLRYYYQQNSIMIVAASAVDSLQSNPKRIGLLAVAAHPLSCPTTIINSTVHGTLCAFASSLTVNECLNIQCLSMLFVDVICRHHSLRKFSCC